MPEQIPWEKYPLWIKNLVIKVQCTNEADRLAAYIEESVKIELEKAWRNGLIISHHCNDFETWYANTYLK